VNGPRKLPATDGSACSGSNTGTSNMSYAFHVGRKKRKAEVAFSKYETSRISEMEMQDHI